jgi:hypothetical protein
MGCTDICLGFNEVYDIEKPAERRADGMKNVGRRIKKGSRGKR